MQKTALYLIILLGALLTGCSERKETYKIGVSQCSQGRWRDKVDQEMLAAQHLYEQDAKVTIAHSHDDTELQVRQIGVALFPSVSPGYCRCQNPSVSRCQKGFSMPVRSSNCDGFAYFDISIR